MNKRPAPYELVHERLMLRGLLLNSWEGHVGEPCSEPDEPRALGEVVRRGWTEDDGNLWEHREIIAAICECPTCGREVECLADTDCWTETGEGTRVWRHNGYGPAMGECCGLLLADSGPGLPMRAYEVKSR